MARRTGGDGKGCGGVPAYPAGPGEPHVHEGHDVFTVSAAPSPLRAL